MILLSRRNGKMVGTRWMFRAMVMVALCALPGLVFSADVLAPTKAVGKSNLLASPSGKTERITVAPTQVVQPVPAKVDAAPAAAQAGPDMTKKVKSLSDQVASLKKEMDQMKRSNQAKSKPQGKRNFR